MSGGIRRRANLLRQLNADGKSVILENGGLIGSEGRQSELKAETLAEIFGDLGAVIHLKSTDLKLGPGALASVDRLAKKGAFVSGVSSIESHIVPTIVVKDQFAIGGVTANPDVAARVLGTQPIEPKTQVEQLVKFAGENQLTPVVMLEGGKAEAEQIAKDFPSVGLVVYTSHGDPEAAPQAVGNTTLITPGELGKHVIQLNFSGGKFGGYSVLKLGPDVADDPKAARLFKTYLERVNEEGLLDRIPRAESEGFAGSKSCRSCHQEAYDSWEKSKHAHALKTLEIEGQDRDPDCVGCHVVGLDRMSGFISRNKTPDMADVGCESCHGPAANHVQEPAKFVLGKVGKGACLSCHNPQTSPNFSYDEYWSKIVHK